MISFRTKTFIITEDFQIIFFLMEQLAISFRHNRMRQHQLWFFLQNKAVCPCKYSLKQA